MKKKVLALMLCGAMIAGTLTGCGNSEPAAESKAPASSEAKTESSAAPAESSAAPVEEPEERVEVTWLGYYTSNLTVAEDSYAELAIEEACPWIDLVPVTDVSAENFDAWFASGEIFDITCFCAYLGGGHAKILQNYNDGVIREIPEEYLWEYAPTHMQILSDYMGEDYFEDGNHLIDGKVLNIPGTTTQNTPKGTLFFRKDWLDNLGLEEPSTLQEFHDMLYAFTYDDPDGNGKDDTYGMSPIYAWAYCNLPFFGTYGFHSPTTYTHNEDGSVTFWGVDENYRQALGLMKEWLDEGILDPECITDDRSAARVKWAAGQLGVMGDSQTWGYFSRGPSGIAGMVEEVFGEGAVSVLGPMTSEYNGELLADGMVWAPDRVYNTVANYGLSFTADATDEQIIAVLKMYEEQCTNDELMMKILYGEEGTDYTMVDGKVKVNADVSVEYQANKGLSFTYYGYGAKKPEINQLEQTVRDVEFIAISESVPSNGIKAGNNFHDVSEVANQYGAEVNKVVNEFHHAVLMGNKSLETDWDEYVAKLNAAGLDKIIADYEAILND